MILIFGGGFLIKGVIKGEFLYDYDKIRMNRQKAKDRILSFPERKFFGVEDVISNFYSLVYVYDGDSNVYIDDENNKM